MDPGKIINFECSVVSQTDRELIFTEYWTKMSLEQKKIDIATPVDCDDTKKENEWQLLKTYFIHQVPSEKIAGTFGGLEIYGFEHALCGRVTG
jgi:hypothetical protein